MARRLAQPISLGAAVLGVALLLVTIAIGPSLASWHYDLDAYLSAAHRILESGSPYTPSMIADPVGVDPHGIYRYAPPLAVAAIPLSFLDPGVAAVAWALLHIAAASLACALMPVPRTIRLGVFAALALSFPLWRDLMLGNASTLVLLASVVAWRKLDRPAGAIALILAAMIRPNILVAAVAPASRTRGRWLLWMAVAGVATVALCAPLIGVTPWFDFVALLRNLRADLPMPNSADLGSVLVRAGLPVALGSGAMVILYGVAGASLLVGLRRDRDAAYVSAMGASLLAAPLLWDHYLVLLALPAALLAVRWHPMFVVLPLMAWAPAALMVPIALFATVAPLMARPRVTAPAVDGRPLMQAAFDTTSRPA